MRVSLLMVFLIYGISQLNAQNSKWSINVNYGLQYNHFVDYGRSKTVNDGIIAPVIDPGGVITHYQKRNIGSIRGIELEYALSDKNIIGLGYEESMNQGRYNVTHRIANNIIPIFIQNFELRHKNKFYELFYKRKIGNDNNFILLGGISYYTSVQQEIDVFPQGFVEITQRDKKNYNLDNAGIYFGAEYFFFNSGNFNLGLRSKVCISIYDINDIELENIVLSPVLKYTF